MLYSVAAITLWFVWPAVVSGLAVGIVVASVASVASVAFGIARILWLIKGAPSDRGGPLPRLAAVGLVWVPGTATRSKRSLTNSLLLDVLGHRSRSMHEVPLVEFSPMRSRDIF